MHILVTADTVGGVWTYTRELVCGLLSRGHRVTLISFGRMPSRAQCAWLENKNITYLPTDFPLEWMQDAADGVAESEKYLQNVVRSAKPDVIHLSQFCYGRLDCGVPKVVVAHSDVVSWWNTVHDDEPPVSSWMSWYTDIVSRGLSGADVVIAPSQWMLRSLMRVYGDLRRTRVVYNGCSSNLFSRDAEKTTCVLSVGRLWDEAKQVSLLLERTHAVPVWIAGSMENPGNGLKREMVPADGVRFWGERDGSELRALYSDSAMYAATSRYEPFGLAPVEAALSRCALILNDIPTFRELWGDAGFYFQRNDPNSLAQAIATLSEQDALRKEIAERGYQRAVDCFSSDRMVAQYEQIYRQLTGKAASA